MSTMAALSWVLPLSWVLQEHPFALLHPPSHQSQPVTKYDGCLPKMIILLTSIRSIDVRYNNMLGTTPHPLDMFN